MTKKKAAEAAAKPGHNSGLDPAAERAFVREFTSIKEVETEMAEDKGKLSGCYKRLENFGFTKDDVKWAKELEKKNAGEVIATMRRRLAIASLMGHQVGRQFDMFDKDRTPIEDAAYLEGLAAGKLRKGNANPYGMETAAGQNWQTGFNEGHAFANEAMSEALNDNVIKGPDVDDDDRSRAGEGVGDADDDDDDVDVAGERTGAEDDDWDRADPHRDAAE